MEFKDIITARYSVRGYENTPVSEETLQELFNVVRMAPSDCNYQPWVFIVVRHAEAKKALGRSYDGTWFLGAPVIIAAGYDTTSAWRRADGKCFGGVDTAIALDHLTLAAADCGLGTCWIGAFDESIAREAAAKNFISSFF